MLCIDTITSLGSLQKCEVAVKEFKGAVAPAPPNFEPPKIREIYEYFHLLPFFSSSKVKSSISGLYEKYGMLLF